VGDQAEGLATAIEELYGVFAAYPLRPWTEPCMHCHTHEDERTVHRYPLRRLGPEDLAGFAGDALMTWGEVVDFKHFVPRIFEILATDGFPGGYPETETVVGALDRGDWQSWPRREKRSIDRFLLAWWQTHLDAYPTREPVDTVLSAIATAAVDMAPHLDTWAQAIGTAPVLHLAAMLHDNTRHGMLRDRLSNPWLRDRPAQEAQVRRWLLTAPSDFLPRLEAAFLAVSDEPTLYMLESAIDLAELTPGRFGEAT
jgi:hypothetical protein